MWPRHRTSGRWSPYFPAGHGLSGGGFAGRIQEKAKVACRKVLDSPSAGIERPLAYPEAKRKVQAL